VSGEPLMSEQQAESSRDSRFKEIQKVHRIILVTSDAAAPTSELVAHIRYQSGSAASPLVDCGAYGGWGL